METLKKLAEQWEEKALHEADAARNMTGITSLERAHEHSAGLLLRCAQELKQAINASASTEE